MLKALFKWLQCWLKGLFAPQSCPDDRAVEQQWAEMGQKLAHSLSLGANETVGDARATDARTTDARTTEARATADSWTARKWIQIGQSLSHIHPGI